MCSEREGWDAGIAAVAAGSVWVGVSSEERVMVLMCLDQECNGLGDGVMIIFINERVCFGMESLQYLIISTCSTHALIYPVIPTNRINTS